jgi:hypothetical protein
VSRALIATVVAAAIAAGGYVAYRRAKPPEPIRAVSREAPAPVLPRLRAEFCAAQDARYAYREDPTLSLRLTPGLGRVAAIGAGAENYDNLGDLLFVVKSADGREFRFAAASSVGFTTNYLFPMSGSTQARVLHDADLIQASTFNTDLQYVPGLPRLDHAAPAHIYAPNLPRYLFNHGGEPRIEARIGFFDFEGCDASPLPTAAGSR